MFLLYEHNEPFHWHLLDLVLLDVNFHWEMASVPGASLYPTLSCDLQKLLSCPVVASASTVLSVSDHKYMLCWQDTLDLADLPVQKGSVELLKQRWESTSVVRPDLMLHCSLAPWSLVPDKISCSSTMQKVPAESMRVDAFKQETLGGFQQTEHVPVTVEELRSHFEALGDKKVRAWAGWALQSNGMAQM